MIDERTLHGLALCKRNNIRNILNGISTSGDNQTNENIEEFLIGYDDATNDIISDNVPFNIFEKINTLSCSSERSGYLEAVSTIAGILVWEQERDREVKIFNRHASDNSEEQQFKKMCKTFDKVFYTSKLRG